jgi:hypothetical protein
VQSLFSATRAQHYTSTTTAGHEFSATRVNKNQIRAQKRNIDSGPLQPSIESAHVMQYNEQQQRCIESAYHTSVQNSIIAALNSHAASNQCNSSAAGAQRVK